MIYAIVGPTGSGKTEISKTIAHRFDLPIINADAFQIYQEMDIGTAKISKDDEDYGRHYLIDIVKPNETYSVKQYQEDCLKVLETLRKSGKDILISGGTGLYIRAALYDYTFPEQEDVDVSKYDKCTNDELVDLLKKVDPEALKTIHPNNRKRIIRALAISESGVSKSENIASQEHKLRFDDVEFLFLNPNRDELYQLINKRVDKMFALGLVDEVKTLVSKYQLSLTAYQAIGYKEVIGYLNNEYSLEECKEIIKQRSRNYAKRQVTYFKHQLPCIEFNSKDKLIEYLSQKIKK